MIKKPMLAAATMGKTPAITEKNLNKVMAHLPLLASVKLDGIRTLTTRMHGPVTRKFKPIANDYIRHELGRLSPQGLDGEVITLHPNGDPKDFNEVSGDVMRKSGKPNFLFIVFDCFEFPQDPFETRLARAKLLIDNHQTDKRVFHLHHELVTTREEVDEFARESLHQGYEGAMLRDPKGPYKEGRSTVNQAWLVKVKQFDDAEGTIIGFEERMHNANKATKDATGHTERSTHKANMVPMGTLGALILDTEWGELKVGTGFDDKQRKHIWNNQKDHLGKLVTFIYQPYGMKDVPRFPVFKGFRSEDDT